MFPGGRKLQQIVKDKETKKTGYGFCPWLVIVENKNYCVKVVSWRIIACEVSKHQAYRYVFLKVKSESNHIFERLKFQKHRGFHVFLK